VLVLADALLDRRASHVLARMGVVLIVRIAELQLGVLLPDPRVHSLPHRVPQLKDPAHAVLSNALDPKSYRMVNALAVVEVRRAYRSCLADQRKFDCAAATKPTARLRPGDPGHSVG
jgi:hypothetical protein